MRETGSVRVSRELPDDQVICRYFPWQELVELVRFQQLLFEPADALQRLAFAHMVGGSAAPGRAGVPPRRARNRREIHALLDRRLAYQEVSQAALLGFQKWKRLPPGGSPEWDEADNPDDGVYVLSRIEGFSRFSHVAPDRGLYVEPLPARSYALRPAVGEAEGACSPPAGDCFVVYRAHVRRSYEAASQRLYVDLGDFLHGVRVSPRSSARFVGQVRHALRDRRVTPDGAAGLQPAACRLHGSSPAVQVSPQGGLSLPGRTAVFQ